MKAEIISIGTEILCGQIVNTNASYLSRKLTELGIEVYFQSTVGDHPRRLSFLLNQAWQRSEIIITTGGLGPTGDDITLKTIAKTFQCHLVFNKKIFFQIKNHFTRRGLKMPPINRRQAYLPVGSYILENRVGTAPGFILKKNKKFLIALPGPPSELIPMFEERVVPFIKERLKIREVIFTRTLKFAGLSESEIEERIKDLWKSKPSLAVGVYAHPGEIELKITTQAKNRSRALQKIASLERIISQRLGPYIFGKDKETLEEVVGKLLFKKRKSLAVAESCSGGLLAHRITNVSGSSRYFISGVIAYSNTEKVRLLKIPSELIRKYGAVSREVAEAMAKNIRKLTKTDIGIGITGIAGPKGGSLRKPVGLVYIALSTENKTRVKEFHFLGDRLTVKMNASQEALEMLRQSLLNAKEQPALRRKR
ncbi:MAG: competence/damage-inducible protein A [Candidatus Omnitrophica bacterium]|nr:competence/damage-inducible protein A [Candidatus Omnitrophota bacterium]